MPGILSMYANKIITPLSLYLVLFIINGCLLIPIGLANTVTHVNSSINHQVELMVPLGHTDSIYAAEFSADGRVAASLGHDQILRVWDVFTGREIKRYKMASDTVKALALSPNGYWVASGGEDNTIKLWDVATGEKIQIFSGHERQVNALVFSPDGQYLLSAGNDRVIKRWDIKTAQLIAEYREHQAPVRSLSYSPDGQWFASAGDDKQVLIWDVNSNNITYKLSEHQNKILAVKFSPSGKYLASAGRDETIILWDWKKSAIINKFNGHQGAINSIDFSDHNGFLSAGDDKTIRIWDIEKGIQTNQLVAHSDSVLVARFSPDNHFILSGSQDNTLKLWGVKAAKPLITFEGLAASARAIQFANNDQFIFSAHEDRTAKVWDLKTGKNIQILSRHEGAVNSLSISHDNKYLATGSDDNNIHIWNIESGELIKKLIGHKAGISHVLFSQDGSQLFSSSFDAAIKLWDRQQGTLVKEFMGHNRSITALALSHDNRFLLSAAKDNTFRQWNVKTGESKLITELGEPISAIKILDDSFAITAGWDVKLWSLSSGKVIRHYKGHTSTVNDISVSHDGKKLATVSWDSTIRIWDIETGVELKQFKGHDGGVSGVDFANNGEWLATSGIDGTIKLWDIVNDVEIVSMIGAKNGEWISFTPEGFYDRSPEGSNLVHWVEKEGTRSYSFQQFETHFRRPDIIKARLDKRYSFGRPIPDMHTPPDLKLSEHLLSLNVNSDSITLDIELNDRQPLETVRFFVNGKAVFTQSLDENQANISVDIPLFSGSNQVTAIAYNVEGLASDPRYFTAFSAQADPIESQLHILAVGVDHYKYLPVSAQLAYARSDASHFIERFKNASQAMYASINSALLTDEQANQESIFSHIDRFSLIEKNDLVLMFFAGHGVRDPDTQTFYLVNYDTDLDNLKDTAINWDKLSQHIAQLQSRVIVFIDACHSASISNQVIVPNNELAERFFKAETGGVIVFSAAKGRQFAQESESFGEGEGLFSYAISKALKQDSTIVDKNASGYVELSELFAYVQNFVDVTSEGAQTPWVSHKEMFGDLPIAKVNSKL